MKSRFTIIRYFLTFLLGHTVLTAACHTWRPSSVVNVAVVLQQLPRGGGGGGGGNDTLTKQRQNTTMTTTTDEDTAFWVKKFQLLRRNTNRSSNGTPTTPKTGDDVSQSINSNSEKGNDVTSPVIQSVNTASNKTTGWFQQRKPWKKYDNTTAPTSPSSQTSTLPTTRTRWGKRKSSKELPVDQNNTAISQPITTTTTNSTPSSTTPTTSTTTLESNNSTTNSTHPPNHMVTPANSGVIVIGPGLTQQQQQQQQPYYRGQPVIIRGTSSATGPTGINGVTSNPSNSVAIVLIELISVVLGKVMYLWFFTWLTKHLAQQEEGMIMPTQHYVWERLNDRYCRDAVALKTVLREPPLGVSPKRWHRQHVRQVLQTDRRRLSSKSTMMTLPKLADTFTRTVVVVELSASSGNSATIDFKAMPDVISFLLQQQRQHAFGTSKVTGDAMPLEIVFIVNSPGGEVSTYGLAAAQMRRLKNQRNITTTVCVDQYAASGGFMIASQADKLVAAPFATIGSVGVILEGLNFYELAKRYGVQPLVLKAGESKRPLSQWGPVTRQDLAQEQSRLGKVHEAFKEFVTEGRPGIAMHAQQVMDGSVYLGLEARSLGLIDDVMTTDEYIFDRIEAGDRVLRLRRSQQGLFNRQLRVSPLDILPHLRSWLSNALKLHASKGDSYD